MRHGMNYAKFINKGWDLLYTHIDYLGMVLKYLFCYNRCYGSVFFEGSLPLFYALVTEWVFHCLIIMTEVQIWVWLLSLFEVDLLMVVVLIPSCIKRYFSELFSALASQILLVRIVISCGRLFEWLYLRWNCPFNSERKAKIRARFWIVIICEDWDKFWLIGASCSKRIKIHRSFATAWNVS